MTYKEKSAGGILGMFSLLLRRGQETRRSWFSSRFLGPAWIWVLELLPTNAQRKTQLRDTAEKQTWSPDFSGAQKINEVVLTRHLYYTDRCFAIEGG